MGTSLQPQEWDSLGTVWQGRQGQGRGVRCSPLASVTVGARMLGASGCAPGFTSVVEGARRHMGGSASWALLSQALQEGWEVAGAMAALYPQPPCTLHPLGSHCCLPAPPRVSRQGRSQQATG